MAIGLKKGDEVIVPNQTHVSTVHTFEILGAKPIFIDSDRLTGNIDFNEIMNEDQQERMKCGKLVFYSV